MRIIGSQKYCVVCRDVMRHWYTPNSRREVSMKILLGVWVLVSSLLTPFHLSAQESERPDSSWDGRKALTFSFDGFRLEGGLGGTYWFNRTYALKLILTGSYVRSENLTDGSSTSS